VLINGLNNSATPPRDTWEWDGATWLQRTPQVQVSGPLVYDRLLGRVLVVTSYGAIHSWNGSEWEPIAVYAPIDQRPSPMSLAWHDGLGRVVSLTSNSPTLWSLALRPAQLEALGAPCPSGSGNDCDLLALGRPRLGNDRFELDLRGGVANTYGAVVLGLTPGATLLPGGCTLQVDTVVASELLWLGAGGYGRVRLPIPAATMLVGVAIYVQGFALDGTGPLQGVSVAPGLRLQVGF
jgi:hypothetical protein